MMKYILAFLKTSSSIDPKNRVIITLFNRITIRETTAVISREETISCMAERQASCFFPAPSNCEVTTAPPVASAASTDMTRLFTMSIRDTPDIAASPTFATIIISAMPTMMVRACSSIRGIISLCRSLLLNSFRSIQVSISRFVYYTPLYFGIIHLRG